MSGEPVVVLLPHQQRVVIEHAELRERLTRLSAFLDNDKDLMLPAAERDRMWRQAQYMEMYAGVLEERIAAFGK